LTGIASMGKIGYIKCCGDGDGRGGALGEGTGYGKGDGTSMYSLRYKNEFL
jgi:hypothetical protein